MKLNELTIKEYSYLLQEKKAVPGGGSALSLVLELAIDLDLMVVNFTIDKKGYEQVRDEMISFKEELSTIKLSVNELINEDGVAYKSLMEAYKSNDEEKIKKASLYACEVPYRLYMFAKRVEELTHIIYLKGNKNLKSDAKIALDLCKAIYPGSVDNIKCNINNVDEKEKDKYLKIL